MYTLFRTARPKNHTLSSGTSPYSPSKGVLPPRVHVVFVLVLGVICTLRSALSWIIKYNNSTEEIFSLLISNKVNTTSRALWYTNSVEKIVIEPLYCAIDPQAFLSTMRRKRSVELALTLTCKVMLRTCCTP